MRGEGEESSPFDLTGIHQEVEDERSRRRVDGNRNLRVSELQSQIQIAHRIGEGFGLKNSIEFSIIVYPHSRVRINLLNEETNERKLIQEALFFDLEQALSAFTLCIKAIETYAEAQVDWRDA